MNRRIGSLILAGAISASGPMFALAQQPAPESSLATKNAVSTADTRVDVSFAGGTVREYVEAIAKAFGSANAAVFPGIESKAAAAVQLRQVTRDEAMHLVSVLTGGSVYVERRGDVFAILPQPGGGPRELGKGLRVWPLAKVLARMKPEEALSAVKAALDLAGEGAEVKFHQDTTLLIVNGTGPQIDAVDQVVDRLENVAGWREGEADRVAHAGAATNEEVVTGLTKQIESLQKDREALAERVHELEVQLADLKRGEKRP